MPDKHIKFSESLLGLGGWVLDHLDSPKTIDELWAALSSEQQVDGFIAHHNFENVVLAVDTLYAIGAIAENSRSGELRRCA